MTAFVISPKRQSPPPLLCRTEWALAVENVVDGIEGSSYKWLKQRIGGRSLELDPLTAFEASRLTIVSLEHH